MDRIHPQRYPHELHPMTELQKRYLQIGCKGGDEKQVVDGKLRIYLITIVAAIF